jgi:alpha-galactosidase
MYYAFFAPTDAAWRGTIELRGLNPGTYRVLDYPNNKVLGSVEAQANRIATLKTTFKQHLLIEVSPQ